MLVIDINVAEIELGVKGNDIGDKKDTRDKKDDKLVRGENK
jgi:hypothetical protein